MPNEINRILQLLTDLQHGESWVGTNFKEALHGVNATNANVAENSNSIWQIVMRVITIQELLCYCLGLNVFQPVCYYSFA